MLGVIYGVLLWADMTAATPLGAWGRSLISLGGSYLDLNHAAYAVYGVTYIGLVSPAPMLLLLV